MSLASLGLITPQTMREHRARWFVYAGPSGGPFEKIPHNSKMRGSWAGYDVTCSCGWESCTGGAIRSYVADKLDDHRFDVQGTEADKCVKAKECPLYDACMSVITQRDIRDNGP